MSFSDYSLTPSLNVTIGAVSVAEGCPAGNMNNAVRQLASDGKELANTVAAINLSGYMPRAYGTFLTNPNLNGKGGYLYHNFPSQTDGAIFVLATGSALPTPAEGAFVFFY